jgi:predicted  nucleic acid-binding Zn-ribbon protein
MNNLSKILIAVVVLQTAGIVWLAVDRNEQKTQLVVTTQTLTKTTDEKKNVEENLKNMLQQYENLKTNNSKINAQLQEQQTKIKDLMQKLQSVDVSDHRQIKELEDETETLREIMRSYIRQIDSLNTKNKTLVAENKKVKEKIVSIEEEKKEITTQRDSLSGTIQKASLLKTYSITMQALNDRDKSTARARKATKFQVCFTLGQNVIAKKGTKTVYIRIAGPDGVILINKESAMFNFGGKQIVYSSLRQVEYNGADMEVCIFWTAEAELIPGKYEMNIFVDGADVGQTSLELK